MTTTSWYRRTVWQAKGNREYTRTGYEAASQRFGENELDVDCSDKHFMITGGNSGIGLATAEEIARRGGILHLVCRNATTMKEARSHIITSTGNDRIYQHQLDLSKPKEVARFAEEFLETHERLDVLINNAGCMIHERTVNEENLETNFAVNVLAVHIITVTLLPLLQRSDDPRVITVSSAGMLTVKLDPQDFSFETMDPFNGRLAYSQTKRQQVIMNFVYAQRYGGIKFFSMHPGWVDTPSVRQSLPEFYEMMKENLRTPHQGADTVIWLAISEAALKHSSGLFFQDRAPTPTHLPLAWTRSSSAEEQELMKHLDELYSKYSSIPNNVQNSFASVEEKPEEPQTNSNHQTPQEPESLSETTTNHMSAENTFPDIHNQTSEKPLDNIFEKCQNANNSEAEQSLQEDTAATEGQSISKEEGSLNSFGQPETEDLSSNLSINTNSQDSSIENPETKISHEEISNSKESTNFADDKDIMKLTEEISDVKIEKFP